MRKITKVSLAVFAVGLLAWLAFGFFGIQALFTDNEVEEQIPEAVSNLISQSSDAVPSSEGKDSQVLGRGSFKQGDSTYTISGQAFLSRVNGQLNLTFTGFEVTNGPDLFVYAVKT